MNNIGTARRTKEDYYFYKFLMTLTKEELMVLFKKRKEECKYGENIMKLRTDMAIINDVYEKKEKQTFIYDD